MLIFVLQCATLRIERIGMASSTTTIRLNDAEKAAWGQMAEFEGKSISSIIKEATWEAYEDWRDIRIAKREMNRYRDHPEEFRPFMELYDEIMSDEHGKV